MKFTIETYRLKDKTIVFDYPEFFIYKEPLVKETDIFLNEKSMTKNFIITFSNYPFNGMNNILFYHHSVDDGTYYIEQISNSLIFLCPMIEKFFSTKQKRRQIFAKIETI